MMIKPRCFIFIVVFFLWGASLSFGELLCSFSGSWDFAKKELDLIFEPVSGGRIGFQVAEQKAQTVDFQVDLAGIKLLLFDITAEMMGTAKVVDLLGSDPVIEGVMDDGGGALLGYNSHRLIKGGFKLKEDKIFLENCLWEGLQLQGYCSLVLPFEVDLSLKAQHVLLVDLLSWLGQEGNDAQGEVSGEIHFSGFLDCLAMKGKLFSSGQIGDFRYDSIVASFQGFYPKVKLMDTSVTQEGGISFFLEGNIDLSKDFKNFSEQLAKMKMLPLIRQTDVDREWTIRRETQDKKSGETEFKYRLRKEREFSGVGEGGMLTIQRSIKF